MQDSELYLAVDIGASSGRLILGQRKDDKLTLEEVRRFPNGLHREDGHLCWDVDALFDEIVTGLKKCAAQGKCPVSIGIDTWAVDYVLLDGAGKRLGPAVGYRDARTEGMPEKVYARVPEGELYRRTGIQKQDFNTIFQLEWEKERESARLERSSALLLVPDYLNYRLTGRMCAEYTNATTTGLVGAESRDWDWQLIDKLGYPRKLFQPIRQPGAVLGALTPEIAEEVGFTADVMLPATHDTGSAVAAVPSAPGEDPLYISSGTWSLLGTERPAPDCSPESAGANFTNEGGWGGTFRHLKNIMGLWMIQSVRRELPGDWSFAQLSALAAGHPEFPALVNVNDNRFLAPESMTDAIKDYCRATGQPVPEETWELLSVLYQSLASCYADSICEVEALTGKRYSALHIMGGGCQDGYLNALTAKTVGKPVLAGPVEATAVGNLMLQMVGKGVFRDVPEARRCVAESFPITRFEP